MSVSVQERESYIFLLDSKASLWLCVASVVGPALTFRIHQNEHNMTAAEVAAKAGEAQKTHTHADTFPYPHINMKWKVCGRVAPSLSPFFTQISPNVCCFFTPTVSEKSFLESETGLKIIQTGVGEVRNTHTHTHLTHKHTHFLCNPSYE